MEAARPTHPALIDQHHVLASAFGVVNIPSSIWIDEARHDRASGGSRPAPPTDASAPGPSAAPALPPRFVAMFTEASKIPSDPKGYHDALRDWVAKGAESRFALSPEEVIARSRPRNADVALGHAHFELATALELDGHHDAAIAHFREAHRLVPDSWTFRRQAWSLEPGARRSPGSFLAGPSGRQSRSLAL